MNVRMRALDHTLLILRSQRMAAVATLTSFAFFRWCSRAAGALVEVKGVTSRCDRKVQPCVGLSVPAADVPGLPGSRISMTRSKPSHPQHTASNYCTALPVCSPGPVLPAQCQDVNTALLTLHTVCAHGYV